MQGFTGFPAGKQHHTPVPNLFFSELLPAIDQLGELKVTLYLFWLLARQTGEHRYVSRQALAADARLLVALACPEMAAGEALDDALERAVARGTLLRVTLGPETDRQDWYFVNSAKGRRSVEDLQAGRWLPFGEPPLNLQAGRPNVFVLYEQNIGPLTPLLAEELTEAEQSYPAAWMEDAFREAVALNKRSWRYVQRILERWAAEGKGDEATRRSDEEDWRRFLKGKYADYIER